jgi:UDP-3-O-[3-hydroxymyristoyl] glucosamine N-acyltransferase
MKSGVELNKIIDFLGTQVLKVFGISEDVYVKYLKPHESVDEFTLDWVNSTKLNKQSLVENSFARVIIVDETIVYTEACKEQNKILIQVKNPKLCILKIGNHYFVNRISPFIDKSAKIHIDAKIGTNAYIGSGASIGNCEIGDGAIIYSNVVINDGVSIGNNFIVKSGAVLGFDGFGYERDEFNNLIKFPQLGNLIIGDNVEIGANTCIDKGSLSDTIIGSNTKINNLCHIAHNVKIGSNVIITAHVNISGSAIIEDNVWIGPNASIRGQQIIGAGVTIGMGAVITKNIPSGEMWFGNPAKKKSNE